MDLVDIGYIACPVCDHKEYSEEILYKMFEAVGSEVPLMEGVQVECTCKKCYFSWYIMSLNQSETTHQEVPWLKKDVNTVEAMHVIMNSQ